MNTLPGGGVLVIAVAGALTASLAAVSLHRSCTVSGYELDAAQRANVRLHRELTVLRERVAALRAPDAVLARVVELDIPLPSDYPERWTVVSVQDILRSRIPDARRRDGQAVAFGAEIR